MIHNKDLLLLEKIQLGLHEDEIPPLEHMPNFDLEMRYSDDETYDLANLSQDDYFYYMYDPYLMNYYF